MLKLLTKQNLIRMGIAILVLIGVISISINIKNAVKGFWDGKCQEKVLAGKIQSINEIINWEIQQIQSYGEFSLIVPTQNGTTTITLIQKEYGGK